MPIFKFVFAPLVPKSLDKIFSKEGQEKTALGVASRFSRGNTNLQFGNVTTQRMFDLEMKNLEKRVAKRRTSSS